MTAQTSESVVRRFFDALDARALDRAVDCLCTAYRGVDLSRSATVVGPAEARADLSETWAAFSDPSLSLRACTAAQEQVSVLWELDGVHGGSCLRIPATHKAVSLSGMGLLVVRDGCITQAVYQWDLAGFLRAAKLLPDLPEGDTDTSVPILSTPES